MCIVQLVLCVCCCLCITSDSGDQVKVYDLVLLVDTSPHLSLSACNNVLNGIIEIIQTIKERIPNSRIGFVEFGKNEEDARILIDFASKLQGNVQRYVNHIVDTRNCYNTNLRGNNDHIETDVVSGLLESKELLTECDQNNKIIIIISLSIDPRPSLICDSMAPFLAFYNIQTYIINLIKQPNLNNAMWFNQFYLLCLMEANHDLIKQVCSNHDSDDSEDDNDDENDGLIDDDIIICLLDQLLSKTTTTFLPTTASPTMDPTQQPTDGQTSKPTKQPIKKPIKYKNKSQKH